LPFAERDSLIAFYDGLADWLGANEAQFVRNVPGDPDAPLLARQTAISMALFIRMVPAGRNADATEIRDRAMSDNLDFLADVLYPGRKIIVWAHNVHIQHRGYGSGSAPVGGFGRWVPTSRNGAGRRSTPPGCTCIAGGRQ